MNVGKRYRHAPARGRALIASMSVIALLALACFPVFAQAECVSSSCVQYTESIPKAEGEHTSPHQKTSHDQKTPAQSSKTDSGGAVAPDKPSEPEDSEGSEGSGGNESSGGGVAGNGNGGGPGQGKPAGSASGKGQNSVQAVNHPKGTSTSQSSDSGSSPLVPILVGIAALAAISVAVVTYRQRRQRRGPAASSPSAKAS